MRYDQFVASNHQNVCDLRIFFYKILFNFHFLLDQKVVLTANCQRHRAHAVPGPSSLPTNVFHRIIKENENKSFINKILVNCKYFGG